jgi:hypothetical protein
VLDSACGSGALPTRIAPVRIDHRDLQAVVQTAIFDKTVAVFDGQTLYLLRAAVRARRGRDFCGLLIAHATRVTVGRAVIPWREREVAQHHHGLARRRLPRDWAEVAVGFAAIGGFCGGILIERSEQKGYTYRRTMSLILHSC